MKYLYRVLIFTAICVLTACQSSEEKHFISDDDYRQEVKKAFEVTKKMASHRSDQLFKVFEQDNLSLEEQEALEFLYAYMPLNDLANYDGEFFLNNLRYAFVARDTFSWGAEIPEDVFRHFVLPYRINNEDMDTARGFCFKELYPRVKDMDMETAALEVNHWCHEKVNYKGTDGRTMAPLGVIKTAYGRCGEESTFTVTAMRSVGIPARQVYTPRWAHTDDNHAWVEVYIDGKWKFLGACEPLPALNMGWFDASVLRAMMVHTKAFGRYQGSEKVIEQKGQFSNLNLLSNYVSVKEVCVQVQDAEGFILKDAYVEFGLYNYAEFYPLKRGLTNKEGCVSLSTGYGSLRILASKDEQFALQMIDVSETDTLKIVLNRRVNEDFSESLDYIAPVAKVPDSLDVNEVLNEKRLLEEDKIRESYIATFYTPEKAQILAQELGLDADALSSIMPESRGNYLQIESYLEQTIDLSHSKQLRLLELVNPKDLHDINANTLIDHLKHFKTAQDYPEEIVDNYILNPRIEIEKITAYRAFLQEKFTDMASDNIEETAKNLKKWLSDNILIDNSRNYYHNIATPQGLYELKSTDKLSRDVFFVAVMRSLGFPARFEEANRKVQYWNQSWVDVQFEVSNEIAVAQHSYVTFKTDNKIDLQYRVHFALAKFDGKKFRTIELGWDKKLSELDVNTVIEPGYYQLITGNRLQNGSVLFTQSYFTIEAEEHKIIDIELRHQVKVPRVIEKINPTVLGQFKSDKIQVLAWMEPKSEPCKHFVAEYQVLEETFKEQQPNMLVLVKSQADKEAMQNVLGEGLDIQIDADFGKITQLAINSSAIESDRLPVFIIVRPNGDIWYLSQGYNIGIPEQILKNMAHYQEVE